MNLNSDKTSYNPITELHVSFDGKINEFGAKNHDKKGLKMRFGK